MTLQKDILAALEKNENEINSGKTYLDRNSDHDFGLVLNELNTDEVHEHIFRYSDGKEEVFSFDN